MEFSRQEYWSRLPIPTSRDPPNPGIEIVSLVSPALSGRFFTLPPSLPASGSFQMSLLFASVAKVLELQLQHQSFQSTPRTDFLQEGLVGSPCPPSSVSLTSSTFINWNSADSFLISVQTHRVYLKLKIQHYTSFSSSSRCDPNNCGKLWGAHISSHALMLLSQHHRVLKFILYVSCQAQNQLALQQNLVIFIRKLKLGTLLLVISRVVISVLIATVWSQLLPREHTHVSRACTHIYIYDSKFFVYILKPSVHIDTTALIQHHKCPSPPPSFFIISWQFLNF